MINRLKGLRIPERQAFFVVTIILGLLAGLSAVLFSLAIDGLHKLLVGSHPAWWRIALMPALVSVVTGILLVKAFPDARGSGIPQTQVAYQLQQGVIHMRTAFGKFLTGVLTVGGGHAMGREGPSVQIGAAIASSVGRFLGLPPKRVKNLVPIGTSAALAAAFNTPLSAVIFTMEEIIGDMNAPVLGSTVIAAVAAVVVERAILGNEPLFHVPAYQLANGWELFIYALLGVIGGGVSVVFSRGLLSLRGAFARMPAATKMWQPAMGGALVGLLLILRPEVSGVGYEYVGGALNGTLVWQFMIVLLVAKLAATIISYASGNAGGIFAPTLFFGAMLGGAVGYVASRVAPFPVAAVGAYALVGMGTMFAGVIRAPMTSVFMIFELTQDYQIIVPLMIANIISLEISRHYQKTPLYHALLEQDGIHLPTRDSKPEDVPVAAT